MEDCKTSQEMTDDLLSIKRLKKELREKEEQLESLKEKELTLSDQNTQLNQRLRFADQQRQQLLSEMGILNDTNETLKAELQEGAKAVEYLQRNNKELEDNLREMRNRSGIGMDSSFDFLNGSSSENSGNSSFIAQPENMANAVVDVRLIDQQRQNQSLTEQVERIQLELVALKNQNITLWTEIADAQTSNLPVNGDDEDIIAELRWFITAIGDKNQSYHSELTSKNTELSQLEDRLKGVTEDNGRFKSNIEEIKKLHEGKIHELQTVVDQCVLKNKDLEAQLTTLRTENVATISELKQTSEQLASLQSQQSEHQISFAHSEGAIKDLTAKLAAEEEKFEVANELNKDQSVKIVDLQAQLGTLQEEYHKLEALQIVKKLQEDQETLRTNFQAQEDELKEIRIQNEKLSQSVVALNAEKQVLDGQIADLTKQISEADGLASKLSESDNKIADLVEVSGFIEKVKLIIQPFFKLFY